MTKEEQEVLSTYQRMQQAMIRKDLAVMRNLTTEDKVFTHMSGKTQTREVFFGEIMNGTLNYYGSVISDPVITVENGRAHLKVSVKLDAKVYGITGSWTLQTNINFIKKNGQWIQCN